MTGRVGVVLNPTSGNGRGRGVREAVFEGLSADGFEVFDLSGPDLATATARARTGLTLGLDALVVVGGDGMVHAGVNAVSGTGVPLGVVAAGTGNDIARDLGLPVHDVPGSLRLVREALAARRDGAHGPDGEGVRMLDVVGVSRPGGVVEHWYLAVLSCGLDAAVNARANELGWPSGNGRYVRAVLAELRRFEPFGYRVTMDGEVWESDGTLVAVANTRLFGGGLRIAPDAAPDDGLLDVVYARGLSRRQLASLFLRLYRGSHIQHPDVFVRRARSVLIEPMAELGAVPPLAFADGEPLVPLPVQCDLHPRAVGVLARTLAT